MAQISDDFRTECSRSPAQLVGALVDAIPYPLIVRDMDMNVVLVNEAAGDCYPGDLLHCKCCDVHGLQDCLCEDCPAGEAFRTGKSVERELRHPETGDYLVVDIHPMFTGGDHACGVIETVRDVTQQRQSVGRIRRLLSQVSAKNEELTQWRSSLQHELNVAREIQRRLVPSTPLCIGRVCFDFLYEPSGEVGGDMYELLPLDGTRVALLVSDASGHGVAAALIAVMVRMVYRSHGMDKASPRQVLEVLNRELVGVVPPGQFATAFYAVFDSERRTLRYARAGHPIPLLVRASNGEVEPLSEGSLVIAALEGYDVEESEVEFGPGDKLLIYTDGVLDAVNHEGEMYGANRLSDAVEAHRQVSGPAFLRTLIQDIEAFVGGADPRDDMTLVLAESVSGEPEERYWLASGTHP